MKRMNGLVVYIAGVLLVGCNAAPEAPDFGPEPGSFASGQYSRITTEQFLYIEDEEAYERLWQRHAGGEVRRPKVDFERHAVIALFAGEKRTGGFAIETRYLEQRDDTLHLEVQLRAPGDNCATTQSFTQPWQLVKTPRGAERVKFEVDRRQVPCW